jgi:DNA-binding beta-propeller fold protein YncE
MKFPRRMMQETLALALALTASAYAIKGGAVQPVPAAMVDIAMTAIEGETLPTGMKITPTVAQGAVFESLNPALATRPEFTAGQAVATAISPNGKTLLVLTSGFNRNYGRDGNTVAEESNEYVFIYDISKGKPEKRQVLQLPNTFQGLAWNPKGHEFYVAGGVDDNVHVFTRSTSGWAEEATIKLDHTSGLGLFVQPVTAGLAVNASGTRLLAANFENDSVSLIDLVSRSKLGELDLRPGINDPSQSGVAGGEYPYSVVFQGDQKAFVSSQRDRELVVIALDGDVASVSERIKLEGQPNKMLLNRAQTRLFVALDNTDTVAVIDTGTHAILEEIETTAPRGLLHHPRGDFKGSNPNSLALSPGEDVLFVTNGGTNSVAVIELDTQHYRRSETIGLIPTAWYPNSVSVSHDGRMLYVVNGKSNAGPNPEGCRDTTSIAPEALAKCTAANQYMWQLHKAGLLSVPVPDKAELLRLSLQVTANNHFLPDPEAVDDQAIMRELRSKIKHVIYVVKENRTYDQVLGDLVQGNGDPSLAILSPYSPNHQELAQRFVTLDNFHDSGEVSGDGWNWTTAARATDFTEKTVPVLYGGRGLSYDYEGTNRNINTGLATLAERQIANPDTPSDPELLPGTADVAAPDGPEGEAGTGYLWDAVLRKGLSVRNYGFYGDLSRYFTSESDPLFIPLARHPFAEGIVQFIPSNTSLQAISDPYFRGYDMKYPDYWRFKEWAREFDRYVADGNLPNLSLVRLPHDHFGDFETAIDGVNTVETQMADNDYALGLLVEKVANSPYNEDTLIFVIEDDAQDGPDHVDAHRSVGYVIGPYVKQGAVVSKHYTTVSMVRTIVEVLGVKPLGLNDALAQPMVEVFDLAQRQWTYTAIIPNVLYTTALPLPPADPSLVARARFVLPKRDGQYWAAVMVDQDFSGEDRLDAPRFNRALWVGLKGERIPYPSLRHGRDLSRDRAELLRQTSG